MHAWSVRLTHVCHALVCVFAVRWQGDQWLAGADAAWRLQRAALGRLLLLRGVWHAHLTTLARSRVVAVTLQRSVHDRTLIGDALFMKAFLVLLPRLLLWKLRACRRVRRRNAAVRWARLRCDARFGARCGALVTLPPHIPCSLRVRRHAFNNTGEDRCSAASTTQQWLGANAQGASTHAP